MINNISEISKGHTKGGGCDNIVVVVTDGGSFDGNGDIQFLLK